MKALELLGQRFGKLVVMERVPKNSRYKWLCCCDCGRQTVVEGSRLRKNPTKSCGCWRTEYKTTHNQSGKNISAEYRAWGGMLTRCSLSFEGFLDYRGRGIVVCDRWRGGDGFQNFFADMGKRPSSLHSLDRIDVDGNYEPLNCRWATKKEQSRNQRKHIYAWEFAMEGVGV